MPYGLFPLYGDSCTIICTAIVVRSNPLGKGMGHYFKSQKNIISNKISSWKTILGILKNMETENYLFMVSAIALFFFISGVFIKNSIAHGIFGAIGVLVIGWLFHGHIIISQIVDLKENQPTVEFQNKQASNDQANSWIDEIMTKLGVSNENE